MSDLSVPDPAPEETPQSSRWAGARARWKQVPSPVRKSFAIVVGLSLILLGMVLIVLPGPFTLPFVLAGTAVLASEFAWAAAVMATGQQWIEKVFHHVKSRVPTPVLIALTVGGVVFVFASGLWLLL